MQEFFGKPFRRTLLGFMMFFVLSVIGYVSQTGLFMLILLGILTIIATAFRLEYGLGIAFLELLSNAHGYILYGTIGDMRLSARMVIFLGVFIGFGIAIVFRRASIRFWDVRYEPFLILALAIAVGGIVGLAHRSFREVFQDGNAYLYLAYLVPIVSISWDSRKQRAALQMLVAGALFNSVATLALLYLFTHVSEPILGFLYVYVRDIRFAEVTGTGMGFFRVFLQTLFFAIMFGLLLFPRLFQEQTRRDRLLTIGTLAIVLCATFISFSRSFWFGIVFALIMLVCSQFFVRRLSFTRILCAIGSMVMISTLSIILLFGTLFFPFPTSRLSFENASRAFDARLDQGNAAASSRWNLLKPMREKIYEEPIFGNGFGQTVTFISNDPRIRAIDEQGTRITASMEWGWLELWLKMGIFGPVGFLFLFVKMTKAAVSTRMEKRWLSMWIVSTLVFLFFTHIFSPYLNHPIGLGTILTLLIFLPTSKDAYALASLKFVKQKMPRTRLATSLVTSRTE